MNSQQKVINLLTMCRKAGRLILGFDAVKEAIYDKHVSSVIVSSDISPKTLKEVRFVCRNSRIDVIRLEMDSYDLYDAVRKKVVVAAISDYGFSEKLKTLGGVTKLGAPRKSKDPNGNNSE